MTWYLIQIPDTRPDPTRNIFSIPKPDPTRSWKTLPVWPWPWTKWWEMQIIGDAATNFFCWHQVQRQTAKNNFDKICFVSYTNTIYTRFCNLYNTVFQFSNIFVNLYNLQFRQLSSASSKSSAEQMSQNLFSHLLNIFCEIKLIFPNAIGQLV